MKNVVALLLLGACRLCFAGGDATVLAIGEWSKPVAGDGGQVLRGRLVVGRGHSPAHAGEWPETLVYVELQNVSPGVVPAVRLYADVSRDLRCELLDGAGKPPPQRGMGGSGGSPEGCWVTLPYDSSIRLRANMFGYGKKEDDGLLLVLSPTAGWDIAADDRRDYFLSGKLTVVAPRERRVGVKEKEEVGAAWTGTLVFPKVKVWRLAAPAR